MDVRHISTAILALALPACFSPNEVIDDDSLATDGPGSSGSAVSETAETDPTGQDETGTTGTSGPSTTGDETTTDESTTGDDTDGTTTGDPGTTGEPDPSAVCGDGMVEGDEACDDAELNGVSGMSDCLADCTFTVCGDGFLGLPGTEECDQGDENADDAACTASCAIAVCGDELVGPGESCDDGAKGSDVCTPACALASCGDGIIQAGEDCDDENDVSTDACINCVSASCGDGVVEAGEEQCDDGAGNASEPIVCAYGVTDDDCTYCAASSCSVEQGITSFCGDGEIQAVSGESCDDGAGNTNSAPTCAYGVEEDDCTYCDATSCSTEVGNTSYCGDGVLQAAQGEQCDDGDNVQGNGCNADCVESGTVLWTHQYITSNDDHLDDPYFKSNSDVVVHLFNASTNQARTLARADGSVVENRDLPEDTVELRPWGADDGYIVREDTASGLFSVGDMVVHRYSESGVEQWDRVFPSSVSQRMAVTPAQSVALTSWETTAVTASSGDRVVRVLDAAGNEEWNLLTPDVASGEIYSALLGLSDGTTVVSVTVPGFLTTPSTIRGYTEGGGGFWTLEFDSVPPRPRAALSGGRWLSTSGSTVQIRQPAGVIDHEEVLAQLTVDFAVEAPNGDIVVAGTGSTSDPSVVARLSPELDVLWETAPTTEDLPLFEVSGLAVGPGNEVLVTAEVYEQESQGGDGWAILLAP
jgi:cysteine-rich repeat protein